MLPLDFFLVLVNRITKIVFEIISLKFVIQLIPNLYRDFKVPHKKKLRYHKDASEFDFCGTLLMNV